MNRALARWLRPVPGQPLILGMGSSLGLHLLLAGLVLLWPMGITRPETRPLEAQIVKLVELPPPSSPKPIPQPPPSAQAKPEAPQPLSRVTPRLERRPASTSRPGPTFSAVQEKPVQGSGPDVAVTGEAIGQSDPPAAPVSGVPAPPGQEEVAPAMLDWGPYHQTVWQCIEARKGYPLLARKRHWEGRVTVDFVIDPGDRLPESRIGNSSGYDELDQAALEAVQRAAPFPAPPAIPSDGRLKMEISVNFQLM